jgi:hypothetical protein
VATSDVDGGSAHSLLFSGSGNMVVVTDSDLGVQVCPEISSEACDCIFCVGSLAATALKDQEFPSGFTAFHHT